MRMFNYFARPQAIVVDIDGTLALMGKGEEDRRGPFDWNRVGEDHPNEPILKLVRRLTVFSKLILVSGRKEQCRHITEMWLDTHLLSPHGKPLGWDALHMRGDDDNRPDTEVKMDIYKQHIEGHYMVEWVIDDRDQVVKMWRSLGLTCLQVADGNF